MLRFVLTLSGVGFALLGPAAMAQDFVAGDSQIDLRVDGQLYPAAITLPLDNDPETVNFGSGSEPITVCFEQAGKSTCRTLQPDEPQDFAVAYDNVTYTLALTYRGPQAVFDEAYRAEHRGTVRIEIPPVYELVNVAIALTSYAAENDGLAARSPYREAVLARFADLRDHPFVAELDARMREDGSAYHTLKMNGAAYDWTGDGIAASPVYRSIGWAGNTLQPLEAAMRDFARQADWAAFLETNADFHDGQIAVLRNEVDIDGMLGWLAREFPAVKPYDSVRVIFSPLVGYNQSMASFEDGEFTELQAHVNFPWPLPDDPAFDADTQPFWQGLILFTELNHGYINPTIEPLASAIGAAMPNPREWVLEQSVLDNYGNAEGVFTEMTNWALFSLRAQDLLPAPEAKRVAAALDHIMVRKRGFSSYTEFQRAFLALRAAQTPGAPVAELIPAMVEHLARVGPTIK